MTAYLAATYYIWIDKAKVKHQMWEMYLNIAAVMMVGSTIVVLEGVPTTLWGRYTFIPLALTSLVSATGLSVMGWGQVAYQLRQEITLSGI
jgi:hypothetical protein